MTVNNKLSCPICVTVSDTRNITLNYSLIDMIDKIRENRFELSEAFGTCDEDTIIFADCEQPQEKTVNCCCFGNI